MNFVFELGRRLHVVSADVREGFLSVSACVNFLHNTFQDEDPDQ